MHLAPGIILLTQNPVLCREWVTNSEMLYPFNIDSISSIAFRILRLSSAEMFSLTDFGYTAASTTILLFFKIFVTTSHRFTFST